MRLRVPHQSSTKWWILLAAVLAALITYWQGPRVRDRSEREHAPDAQGDFVEIEIVGD